MTNEHHGFVKDRWKNRRRMAWLAFVYALAFPIFVVIAEITNEMVGIIFPPLYFFLGGVLTVYIGGVVADDKWQKNE